MGATKNITLSDKRELTIDASTITVREWRGFFDPKTKEVDDDKIIARCCGLKAKELPDLLRDDYRLIFDTIRLLSSMPLDLDNPKNLDTASTED